MLRYKNLPRPDRLARLIRFKSLNPYMTKLKFCSIQADEKLKKTDQNGNSFEMFYRPKMFRLDPVKAANIQDRILIKI